MEILTGQTLTSTDGRITGWVDQPNLRGTWDIIWTCLVTVFICTYSLLCLNVPAQSDTIFVLFRRRVFWMALAIFGPEIVLTYAAGQWSRAKHSVQAFHHAGYEQWTMRLAFFADMGGFVLDGSDFDSFPLNAKQLHWLVVNGHLPYPETTPAEIWDKSKQDRLAKIITSFQIGYVVVQCIGRLTQDLAITTLELNTLAIVVCTIMTAYTWLHKPADVTMPIRLGLSGRIQDITASRPWRNTPLDFVDENGPGWAMNVQPFMNMPVIPPQRPIQRIPNDRFPTDPYGTQEYFLCFATLVFTGLHVAGWNLSFPSQTEKVLWRVSSVLLFTVTAAFWALETVASWTRLGRWKRLYLRVVDPEKLPQFDQDRIEKAGHAETRELATLPLAWEFWTIAPIGFIYGIARVYLIVEAFLELRDINASAFLQVEWSAYIPHI